jgi:uncharacterized radical SAM superfamily Fe-S cluster-containing enzyme
MKKRRGKMEKELDKYEFNRKVIGEVLEAGANPIVVIRAMARYLTAHEAEKIVNELKLELSGV